MSLNSNSNFADFFDELQNTDLHQNINFTELESIEQRYEYLELLGSGGTKSVKRVYDKYTCREVAMALLANENRSNPFDAFLHEARLTAQLDHPNIIKVHDIGIENDRPFFTMDLKTGKSLRELIQEIKNNESNLSLNEKLAIFLKVSDAISYAHSKGIIHLDIKPDNIQVGSYGEVIVCDWGLSATIKPIELSDIGNNQYLENLLTTKSNNFHSAGTPGFMAPEQYSKHSKNNELTDIYGLGALLYSLLTLNPPLTGNLNDIKRATIEGQIPSPISLGIKLPNALDAIILKSMSVKPESRYNSVSEMAKDIRLYMDGFTCSVEKTGFLKEYARLTMRNPKLSAVIYISLILLVTMTSIFISSLNKSKKVIELAYDETALTNKKLKESLIIAEEAQEKAEQALAKYELEKNAFNEVAKTGLSQKINSVQREIFHDPLPSIQALIRIYNQKDDNDSKKHLARAYFISGNLFKANEIYTNESLNHDNELQLLVRKYAPKKEAKMSDETIRSILLEARELSAKYKHLILKMILYDRIQRKDFSKYESILQLTLQYFWNNHKLKITYKNNGFLKFHNKKVDRFVFNHYGNISNLLKFLPINEIDISQTDFYFIGDLGGLDDLSKLNISSTKVKKIPDFDKHFLDLKELSAKGIEAIGVERIPSRVKLLK